MKPRRPQAYAAAAAIVAAAALLSGCSSGGSDFAADSSDITGTWKNPKGAAFSFNTDGTFSAQGVTKALPLPGGCADLLGTGRWHLVDLSRPDTGTGVGRSTWMALDPPGRQATAACGIQAGIRKDSEGVNLCLVLDPDQTCSDNELLRRPQS
jgi:hypothetical protein